MPVVSLDFFQVFFFETMLTKIGESAKQKPRKLGLQREPMEFQQLRPQEVGPCTSGNRSFGQESLDVGQLGGGFGQGAVRAFFFSS